MPISQKLFLHIMWISKGIIGTFWLLFFDKDIIELKKAQIIKIEKTNDQESYV